MAQDHSGLRDWLGPWVSDPNALLEIANALDQARFVVIENALAEDKAALLHEDLDDSMAWSYVSEDKTGANESRRV